MKIRWIVFAGLELLYTVICVYLIPVNLWFGIGMWIVLSGIALITAIHQKYNKEARENK